MRIPAQRRINLYYFARMWKNGGIKKKKPISFKTRWDEKMIFITDYLLKVNLAVKPIAAGSKLISLTIFNSGFQSSDILSGILANL